MQTTRIVQIFLLFLLSIEWSLALIPGFPNRLLSSATRFASTAGTFEASNGITVPAIKKTYYETLGAAPNATRSELKRKYVALARVTHPDALIGAEDAVKSRADEFSQIAQAWRVLSNDKERKRYDRELIAEQFKNNVGLVASAVSRTAVPQVKKVIDDFAVPFLRRTTVTTVASVSAVVDKLADGTNIDLGEAVVSAIKAGERAGRLVDSMELREQSTELDHRADEEREKAVETKARLLEVVDRRLSLSLTTPFSALSSTEALRVLDGLNIIDSVSMWSLRHSIEHDINDLEHTETDYYEKIAEQAEAVDSFRNAQLVLKDAAGEAKQAVEAEIAARKALEEAHKRVAATKQRVNELTKSFTKVQSQERKVTHEVEHIAETLKKRQEKVRRALRKKEIELEKEQFRQAGESISAKKFVYDDDSDENVQEIERLRQEEKSLSAKSAKLDEKISRLASKATNLNLRADAIDDLKATSSSVNGFASPTSKNETTWVTAPTDNKNETVVPTET